MFRIVCDPSLGSIELYLTEIIRGVSQMFVVCLVGVWQRNFEPAVVPYTHTHTHTHTGSKLCCQTPTKQTTNICEPQLIISVKYSNILPDDGSYTIRNMLE